ncbi:MAG: DNA mismatch repair endonuclease MutL [candidate division Zixibacteria bacterium]|nr:DNA mismatch repair endonuclease MutL [candidate division Zixibacteria bacterium]
MKLPQDNNRHKAWIRPLPDRVVNKIAAGEVVERPAAVLKELVENAIDAGSDRIDILVEGAGIKLIRIVDNGCGIAEEQIEIAFSRHATSKIAVFNDLNNLDTYGFRGEALPSIASVSRMRMVSRPHDAASGVEIIFEGGVLQSVQPIPAAPGTTVEVENLFFNTPARRKFLKSEATEARYLSRAATALAIGRADIGFSYSSNGRKLFAVPPKQSLVERVTDVLGKKRDFVPVEGKDESASVLGCVGLPDAAQHNRNGQFIFVNGRYVQSPTLSHAFVAGYGELLSKGLFPVGALLITVDPTEVDVNVHPGKTEVRLAHEREIHHIVRLLVAEGLRRDGIIPAFSQSQPRPSPRAVRNGGTTTASDSNQAVIPGVYECQPVDPGTLSELYRPLEAASNSSDDSPMGSPPMGSPPMGVNRETGEVFEKAEPQAGTSQDKRIENPPIGPQSSFRYVGRFADLYLLIQTGDDLFIVDQHTAHERVLYEEMLEKIEKRAVDGQNLLFPVQVDLTAEQLAVFEESQEMLDRSGFVVSPFGGRMVNIEAVPTVLSSKSPEKVLLAIIDDLASLRKAGQDLLKAMAQSIACRSAVMSGDRLNDKEAEHLLRALMQCREPYSCPHGRPTLVRISKEDINRQFGRG